MIRPCLALIMLSFAIGSAAAQDTPAELHNLAHSCYEWEAREFPVASSSGGLAHARVLQFYESNPLVYVNECSNAIFPASTATHV